MHVCETVILRCITVTIQSFLYWRIPLVRRPAYSRLGLVAAVCFRHFAWQSFERYRPTSGNSIGPREWPKTTTKWIFEVCTWWQQLILLAVACTECSGCLVALRAPLKTRTRFERFPPPASSLEQRTSCSARWNERAWKFEKESFYTSLRATAKQDGGIGDCKEQRLATY